MRPENPSSLVPRLARLALMAFLPTNLREPVIGDFEELYRDAAARHGHAIAALWYWGQTLQSVFAILGGSVTQKAAEVGTLFADAARTLVRERCYSVVSTVGLTLAFAGVVLASIYVANELGYDRYHEKAERIYRLGANLTLGGTPNPIASTNAAPAPAMVEAFPEVVNQARVRPTGRVPVRHGDRQFYEDRLLYADASIFDLFSFLMLRGDPETALDAAHSIVITERIASRYFGTRDPLGEPLTVNDRDVYTVTGILRDVPRDSHFVFDMLCSFETLRQREPARAEGWPTPFVYYSYVELAKNADPRRIESRLPELVIQATGQSLSGDSSVSYFLQPLTRIHLFSDLRHELAPNGDIRYVVAFGLLALAILVLAVFNLANLAAARWAATPTECRAIKRSVAEMLLVSVASLVLALGVVHLTFPFLQNVLVTDRVALSEGIGSMAEHDLAIRYTEMPWLIPGLLVLAASIGLLAGGYPGTGRRGQDVAAPAYSRGLVAAQVSISIVLIVVAGVVARQFGHLRGIALGFDKSHVIVVPVAGEQVRASIPAIKNELWNAAGVLGVGASSHVPGTRPSGGSFVPEGYPEGRSEMMNRVSMDETYLSTMGMEIIEGRGFSVSDGSDAVLVNETAVRRFGWETAVGKAIRRAAADSVTVVGVVRDFHFSSPHRVIRPVYIDNRTDRVRALFVRVAPTRVTEPVDRLRETWAKLDTTRPFEHFFLDTVYDAQYRTEANLAAVAGSFSFVAVFLTCLGLFGVTTLPGSPTGTRAGYRRPTFAFTRGSGRGFLRLSIVANAFAWPVAYLVTRGWLQTFPYRTELGTWVFASAGLIMLVLGLAAISFRVVPGEDGTGEPGRSSTAGFDRKDRMVDGNP
jgi:putative ABC transport system permease protein